MAVIIALLASGKTKREARLAAPIQEMKSALTVILDGSTHYSNNSAYCISLSYFRTGL